MQSKNCQLYCTSRSTIYAINLVGNVISRILPSSLSHWETQSQQDWRRKICFLRLIFGVLNPWPSNLKSAHILTECNWQFVNVIRNFQAKYTWRSTMPCYGLCNKSEWECNKQDPTSSLPHNKTEENMLLATHIWSFNPMTLKSKECPYFDRG